MMRNNMKNTIILQDLERLMVDDYLDLFHRVRKLHMSNYVYSVNEEGVDWYNELLKKHYYYLKDQDINLLASFKEAQVKHSFAGCQLYEIGPGIEDTIRNKSMPLMQTINPSQYIAVDIKEEYASQAALCAAEISGIGSRYIVCNAFKDSFTFRHKAKSLVAVVGNTLGNLTDLDLHMFLRNLAHSMRVGDGLLVTLDYMEDEFKLAGAYNNWYLFQLMLNIMRNLRKSFDNNLDSEAFQFLYKFNTRTNVVEMGLCATKIQHVNIGGHRFLMNAGDKYQLVMSRKFTSKLIQLLAARYGFEVTLEYTAHKNPMRLVLLTKAVV